MSELWLFLLCRDIDITRTYAKDVAVTSSQAVSAHVPAGESDCGDYKWLLDFVPFLKVIRNCLSVFM